ncbi:hypothetical protein LTR15_011352 [Elasticomyces elasticus]|nr:hypothetical protein LTR15_011352 [Elasticomyces elasticus]
MAGIQRDIANLSITGSKGLDKAHRESIKAALESYKHTVLERNLTNLRTVVDGIESRPEARRDNMRNLEQHVLNNSINGLATSPRGLLEPAVRTELVKNCDLDGIYHLPEDFPQDRSAWYAKIRGLLEERDATAGTFPPPDLEYLCTLVDGICGPGLPQHIFWQQYDMLGFAESSSAYDKNTVFVGEASLPIEWDLENGDIELCVKIGRNEEHSWGGSYLLWCRRSANDPWQWRYAAHADENVSDIYDTLEEYLAFYAHFNEQDEAQMRRLLRYFGVKSAR